MNQPTLFEDKTPIIKPEILVLYALGDFMSRGKILADRKLPLDRLRGAFKRAAEHFDVAELSDGEIAETLEKLGAKIVQVPTFVAKHPFRVTVSAELAEKGEKIFRTFNNIINNEEIKEI